MLDLRQLVADRLSELDRNPFEAARIGGLERSFVNDILIRRKKSVKGDNLRKLALALDLPLTSLLGAEAEPEKSIVRVVGRVGAGAEIRPEFEQLPPEGLYEIEVAFPVDADALAFEVEGDSMWPRYDPGDIVICGRQGMSPAEILNWEAAVRTTDGRRFLKRIRRGSADGLFNLESHNAAPIPDVALEWAAEIDHVVRVGKWRRLDREAQKTLVAKTMKRGKG